jgi:hypothetical protein
MPEHRSRAAEARTSGRRRGRRAARIAAVGAVALLPQVAAAQLPAVAPQPYPEHRIFAGRSYDPAVPAPTPALGYALGEHLATYAALLPYLEQLAASSDRVRFEQHGTSYEGRPIVHLAISSPANIARLDEIRANLARLADPRTLRGDDDAAAILRSTPAVVMLVFATDGAETAGPEAALQVAYQLAAANDAATEALLRDVVVVIVPAQNPDSNQRVVAWFNAFRVGPDGTADREAAEHQRPWGFNSNNRYQIDMNRESVWSIQRETQAMVALYREWNPQVFVDNHGEYPEYTGPWYVEPLHEVLTSRQRAWLQRFGEAMGDAFAEHGYAYSAWEFGQFDPGYWDTYPNFSGAIAWTTETTGGGTRGIRLETRDGRLYTLRDGIIQHMIASDVTIRTAAAHREALLGDFLTYKRSAIEEGSSGAVRGYALSADNDPHRLARVVNTLRRNHIDVQRTTRDVRVAGARPYFASSATSGTAVLPAGSYVIPLAQPEGRMLRVLMEPEARFSPEFLQQVAEARAAAQAEGEVTRIFYDITAWSMPLTYHLDAWELSELPPAGSLAAVDAQVRPEGAAVNAAAAHALLIDYASNGAIAAIAQLRAGGVRYRVAAEPFAAGGELFGRGSLVILRAENPGHDLGALARQLAGTAGVRVTGVDAPADDTGARLDSERMRPAGTGRIAVVMDRPTSPNSYGHIWYTLERIYGIDFTALNFSRLASIELGRYDVIVLPDGNYTAIHDALALEIAGRLRDWVAAGGTLIGVRGASAWLARPDLGLARSRLRGGADGGVARVPVVPGTIMNATVDSPEHPLAWGYDAPAMPVMVWSALALDAAAGAEAPIRIADAAAARVSGFAFPESIEHVAGSPYVLRERHGEGAVVLFLDDPLFRLFWDGLGRLFFNAVFNARF